MRRRKRAEAEQEAAASGDGRLTPIDVQQVEFRLAFRGYNERDVDAFLDRITEDLASYIEENRRLRAGEGLAPAPGAGEAGRGAEAILLQAREEAAAIVRRAEQEAAAIRAAAGAGTGDPRAAVAPFLDREREFLQSLGTLVQSHAEEIKRMVLALRGRREAPAVRSDLETPSREEPETVVVEPATEPAFSTSSEGLAPVERRERSLRELFWGED